MLQWPRACCDTVVEALRAAQEVVLEEGDAGTMSARDIHDSYHVHGRLSLMLRWETPAGLLAVPRACQDT